MKWEFIEAKRPDKGKYKPEMIPVVEESYKRGMLDAQVIELLGIGRETFYGWIRNKPDFADAIKKGKVASEARWIEAARQYALNDKRFDAGIWKSVMANAFGWTPDGQSQINLNLGPPEQPLVKSKSIDEYNRRETKLIEE